MVIIGTQKTRDEVYKLMKIMEEDGLTLYEAESTVDAMYRMMTNVNYGRKDFYNGIQFSFNINKEDIKPV